MITFGKDLGKDVVAAAAAGALVAQLYPSADPKACAMLAVAHVIAVRLSRKLIDLALPTNNELPRGRLPLIEAGARLVNRGARPPVVRTFVRMMSPVISLVQHVGFALLTREAVWQLGRYAPVVARTFFAARPSQTFPLTILTWVVITNVIHKI